MVLAVLDVAGGGQGRVGLREGKGGEEGQVGRVMVLVAVEARS
jgi:hypothetical protein